MQRTAHPFPTVRRRDLTELSVVVQNCRVRHVRQLRVVSGGTEVGLPRGLGYGVELRGGGASGKASGAGWGGRADGRGGSSSAATATSGTLCDIDGDGPSAL